ncbi:MAG: 3-hydroxyacyl-[acyl-carrier-protein] dehydratase FabZ [Enterovirga sp.]|jgi:3-hydroxyacyl-[acyl-carrier-protein] dehydratase|nr:3-hydroxyacyl-[acyl-carrier-protein] dehydratase FabZ [Enterovirga sp.]
MVTLLDLPAPGGTTPAAEGAGETLGSADIVRVLELLPHRYPFLLVDRIIAMRGDESCIGIKNVSFNEPQFQGHFPAKPVFPGVLIIEGMAQTAGALCVASQLAEKKPPSKVFFMTIDNAKFRRPVEPGDVLHYHMTKLKNRRNMWWFRGEAKVDGVLVAEAELSAMLVTE